MGTSRQLRPNILHSSVHPILWVLQSSKVLKARLYQLHKLTGKLWLLVLFRGQVKFSRVTWSKGQDREQTGSSQTQVPKQMSFPDIQKKLIKQGQACLKPLRSWCLYILTSEPLGPKSKSQRVYLSIEVSRAFLALPGLCKRISLTYAVRVLGNKQMHYPNESSLAQV